MKRWLARLMLVMILMGVAIPALGQVSVHDNRERKAFNAALDKKDPVARAAAMEEFVRKYPNSIGRETALEALMEAYKSAGNSDKWQQTAVRLLQLYPNNVLALSDLVEFRSNHAQQGNAGAAAELRAYAIRGLAALPLWQKPALRPWSGEQFEQLKRAYYASFAYRLGSSMLESEPAETTGFWYLAKSISTGAKFNDMPDVNEYAKRKYQATYGSLEGWKQLLAQVKSQQAPPANFAAAVAQAAGGLQTGDGKEGVTVTLTEDSIAAAMARMSPAERAKFNAHIALAEGSDLEREGKLEAAIDAYRTAVRLAPNMADTYAHLGNALQQKGELDGAIRELEEAVRLEPHVAEHYFGRGYCYSQKAQYENALADYDKALTIEPTHAGARGSRADALYYTGAYEKAIVDYTTFLKSSPESAVAYSRRGASQSAMGEYAKAIADFNKSLELEPGLSEANEGLAWLLATAPVKSFRNGRRAIQYAQRAVSSAPPNESAPYLDTLAAAYAEVGQFDDAVSTETKAISLLPRNYDETKRAEFQARLQLYKNHQPYREQPNP